MVGTIPVVRLLPYISMKSPGEGQEKGHGMGGKVVEIDAAGRRNFLPKPGGSTLPVGPSETVDPPDFSCPIEQPRADVTDRSIGVNPLARPVANIIFAGIRSLATSDHRATYPRSSLATSGTKTKSRNPTGLSYSWCIS
jgi:hypothetical protein